MALRKLAGFRHQPRYLRYGFAPTWLLLGLARAIILLLPFRVLAARLGAPYGPAAWLPLISPRQEVRARQVARLVARSARHTYWTSNCFPQAIAARLLLGMLGIPCALFLGVRRAPEDNVLQAHAWVVAGRIAVAGGESFSHYAVVASFVALPR